jgi:hypothetical protein
MGEHEGRACRHALDQAEHAQAAGGLGVVAGPGTLLDPDEGKPDRGPEGVPISVVTP